MDTEAVRSLREHTRLDAFGPDLAETFFHEEEAHERYRLRARAILGDGSLTGEEREAALAQERVAFKLDLASRGAMVSLAEERRESLDRRLRERYGKSVDTMSAPERRAAVMEMLRDDMPPDLYARALAILECAGQGCSGVDRPEVIERRGMTIFLYALPLIVLGILLARWSRRRA